MAFPLWVPTSTFPLWCTGHLAAKEFFWGPIWQGTSPAYDADVPPSPLVWLQALAWSAPWQRLWLLPAGRFYITALLNSVRHKHVIHFCQWHVSRRDMCHFGLRAFKSSYVCALLLFSITAIKDMDIEMYSVNIGPWVTMFSSHLPTPCGCTAQMKIQLCDFKLLSFGDFFVTQYNSAHFDWYKSPSPLSHFKILHFIQSSQLRASHMLFPCSGMLFLF